MELTYKITNEINIKQFLLDIGYSKDIMPLIKNNIYFNNKNVRLWNNVSNGTLKIKLEDEESSIKECDINFNIAYEDEYLLIVRKDSGICSMPNKGHDISLAGMVIKYFRLNNIKSTVHLVTRLDKDTSGLVIIAKNRLIHHLIKNINKKYYLVCEGLINDSGIIDLPIKKGLDGIKRIISDDGKKSITEYKCINKINNKSLVEVNLITGRTHQIRLHFSSIGYPIIGDRLYNFNYNNEKLALQCHYIKFMHPIYNKYVEINDLPNDFLSYYFTLNNK